MELVNRLKFYMDSIGVPITQFADICGIPRPSLSQLLNGRNKRISDDVINKIHAAYPDLSILWLMFGEGEMVKAKNIEISEPQIDENEQPAENKMVDEQIDTAEFSGISAASEVQPDNLFSISSGNFSDNLAFQADPELLTPTPKEEVRDINFGNLGAVPHPLDVSRTVRMQPGAANLASNPSSIHTPSSAANHPNQTSANSSAPIGNVPLSHDTIAEEPAAQRPVSIIPDSGKKITNIVVFYTDNSFQSFVPDI